ncbi:hypothetical protein [Larkinella knui]|uniref:hypothetical protein n=1 Tax=Larkinella knui TaxID=2025310 RepID=UPI001C89A293|nr:hypothetical protein [Larkinella knui]
MIRSPLYSQPETASMEPLKKTAPANARAARYNEPYNRVQTLIQGYVESRRVQLK